MQIRSLPGGRQQGLRGNIVNFPANITGTTSVLLRTTANCQTIFVSLKQNLDLFKLFKVNITERISTFTGSPNNREHKRKISNTTNFK